MLLGPFLSNEPAEIACMWRVMNDKTLVPACIIPQSQSPFLSDRPFKIKQKGNIPVCVCNGEEFVFICPYGPRTVFVHQERGTACKIWEDG